MLALVLSGCVTEQQQFDVDLYERLHADALALATKVDHGEMSRENATLQLVQMQFVTRNSAAMQEAATGVPVPSTGEDRDSKNEQRRRP